MAHLIKKVYPSHPFIIFYELGLNGVTGYVSHDIYMQTSLVPKLLNRLTKTILDGVYELKKVEK